MNPDDTAKSGGTMTPAVSRVPAQFARHYGQAPTLVWSAPGRINLIGEHTDYNEGFVLPFALPQRTAVAAGPHDRPEWTVWSEATDETVSFDVSQLQPGAVTGWAGYVAGVVWALREEGLAVPPARLAICSDVPAGAGLSSSAALECATLAALLGFVPTAAWPPMATWPALAQQAENTYVGVPCGIMDQSAATLCQPGHALFLDCRSQAVQQIPFDLDAAGLAMLVIDTNAPHRHAGGEYAARRTSCEQAARHLGLASLRDVTDLGDALAQLPDDLSRRRVRHVVTENDRVRTVVASLAAGESSAIGAVLTASHTSLRDDYEVTVPELDVAVAAALAAGALGARMTGGGFGGCVIALVRREQSDQVAHAVIDAFASSGFATPMAFVAVPSGGVSRVSSPVLR